MAARTRHVNALLVEGNTSDAVLVSEQITQSHFAIDLKLAESLGQAIEQVRHDRYDVVLIDLTLPDSQGLATFKELNAVAGDTPIIVLTVQDDTELGVQAVREGAQDYLLKSKISADSLVRSIRYAVERARRRRAESELTAAGTIQRGLFPKAAPRIKGFDVGGRCSPANFAGGDFFDFFSMGKNQLGVVIADVAGHGIGPAITMSETRAVIRAFASMTSDVGEILTRASAILAKDLTKETFVALFLARIDVADRSLQFATAGHPGFVLTSRGRTKQLLKSEAPPLGLDPQAQFSASPDIQLDAGDSLFLFTDGFAEAVNSAGEQFGRQRVFQAVRERFNDGAERMLDHLFEQLKKFRHDTRADDDITAVIVKVAPPVAKASSVEPADVTTQSTDSVAHAEFKHFQVDEKSGVSVLRFREEEILSSQKCAEVKAELLSYINRNDPTQLVINFESVQRFSSEGINMCFHIKARLDEAKARLVLCGLNSQLREAFRALNLEDTVFEIHDDLSTALGAL